MRKFIKSLCRVTLLATATSAGLFVFTAAYAQDNPNYFYVVKGQLPGARVLQLGDPENWSLPITENIGKSKTGKLSVVPTMFKTKGDAIQFTWNSLKETPASVGIYGAVLDLSKFKNSAALVIDLRVDSKAESDVKVGIDCGYPCKGEVVVNKLITTFPKGQWFSLPIPLNCFKGDTFDLAKVLAPFTMITSGKFAVSISGVHLEKLGADEKGCVDANKT